MSPLTIPATPAPWRPSDNGLVAAPPFPPHLVATTSALTGGVAVLGKCFVPATVTLSNWLAYLGTAGASLTYARAGVYSSAGTLLGRTADLSTGAAGLGTGATTGLKTSVLTAEAGQSLTIAGGPGVFVWAALLTTGTTQPTMGRLPNSSAGSVSNVGLTSSTLFVATYGVSLTALPAPLVPANNATNNVLYWMAFS